jgi:hypothetical protein
VQVEQLEFDGGNWIKRFNEKLLLNQILLRFQAKSLLHLTKRSTRRLRIQKPGSLALEREGKNKLAVVIACGAVS